jgi:TRAP-type C4-dicarboxylate transport system permease small subunit
MPKIYYGIVKLLEYIVGVLFLALAATAFAQVFFRYVLRSPLTWAHELDILLMIWAIWLSAAIGIYRKAHLRITIFSQRLAFGTQRVLVVLIDFFVLLFLIILGIKGIGVVQSMEGMNFISIEIPRGLMFAAAPVGATLMIFLFFPTLIGDLKALPFLHKEGRKN